MKNIRQLVYRRNVALPLGDDDLNLLLLEAKNLNSKHMVTGVLICIKDNFIQLVEGISNDIEDLKKNIEDDKRSSNLFILSDVHVQSRLFPDWSMEFKTFNIEDLKKEQGFLDIDDSTSVEKIIGRHQALFQVMKIIHDSE